MEHRFCVSPFKCGLSLACCLCFVLLGGLMLPLGRWGSAAVFFALGLVFGWVAAFCGAVVHLSSEGVRRTVLGIKTKELRWSQIAEVGVTGTKVFNQRHPEKTGALYIYFSETALTEEDRFNLMLKWPPLDKIHLLYSEPRFTAVQMLWNAKVETYNTGNLPL